jgi:hypothetical protein
MNDRLKEIEQAINKLADETAPGERRRTAVLEVSDEVLSILQAHADKGEHKLGSALLASLFKQLAEYTFRAQDHTRMEFTEAVALQTLGEYFQHAGDWKAARACIQGSIEKLR